ncbi:hypothetical protein M758_UG309500 [Ceratodon purpureus]|nr:hypothetical protein M758_UG309500 [Ceratodon purpureus]
MCNFPTIRADSLTRPRSTVLYNTTTAYPSSIGMRSERPKEQHKARISSTVAANSIQVEHTLISPSYTYTIQAPNTHDCTNEKVCIKST